MQKKQPLMRIDLWKKTVPAFTLLNEHKHSTVVGTVCTVLVALTFIVYTVGRILQVFVWQSNSYVHSTTLIGQQVDNPVLMGPIAFGLQYKRGQQTAQGDTLYQDMQQYITVTASLNTKRGSLTSTKNLPVHQCSTDEYKAFKKPFQGQDLAAYNYYLQTNQILLCVDDPITVQGNAESQYSDYTSLSIQINPLTNNIQWAQRTQFLSNLEFVYLLDSTFYNDQESITASRVRTIQFQSSQQTTALVLATQGTLQEDLGIFNVKQSQLLDYDVRQTSVSDNTNKQNILTVNFGLSQDKILIERRAVTLGMFLAEITGLGLAVYFIFSIVLCKWFASVAMKAHTIVNGFKFANKFFDPYTGQLIPNRVSSTPTEIKLKWCEVLCCPQGQYMSRVNIAYDRYKQMLDLPKFMREMKYLKVAMRGLLSQDQHNFCNRYAMNALVDDADDSEDLVNDAYKTHKKEQDSREEEYSHEPFRNQVTPVIVPDPPSIEVTKLVQQEDLEQAVKINENGRPIIQEKVIPKKSFRPKPAQKQNQNDVQGAVQYSISQNASQAITAKPSDQLKKVLSSVNLQAVQEKSNTNQKSQDIKVDQKTLQVNIDLKPVETQQNPKIINDNPTKNRDKVDQKLRETIDPVNDNSNVPEQVTVSVDNKDYLLPIPNEDDQYKEIENQIETELQKANRMAEQHYEDLQRKRIQKKGKLPQNFQGSFLRPTQKSQLKETKQEDHQRIYENYNVPGERYQHTYQEPDKRYQGVNDLHHTVGLHQMSKNDRKFHEKRKDRIDDIYEKDVLMGQMKKDGFTHFK